MSLRARVLRGGSYLGLRQGLGIVVSVFGVILLTRLIGPGAYGLYSAALAIYFFLVDLGKWGVDTYLIRHEEEPQLQDYHQAFSLLLLLGLAGAGLGILSIPLLERWIQLEGFGLLALALFTALPVNLLGLVPLALFERALDYRKVAIAEFSGQMAIYLVALPLAYQGMGPWAPVWGMWASQLLTSGLAYWMSDYRPRFHWETARVRPMLGYGLGFSASSWVWQLRRLVNPLVVGRYAGAEAVGYIALAIRLVEQLSFVTGATWRLSIAAMARFQRDRIRLVSGITEGMQLQILAVGPLLAGFSLMAAWLVPLLFGSTWLPVLEVYPFIALSYLANAIFNMHSSALYVLRRNWEVTIFHLMHIALFAGGAIWLVPRLGIVGYGWAEVLALVSYGVIHLYTVKEVGQPNYRLAGAWMLAFALVPFWQDLGWVAGLGIVGVSLWPETWRALGGYARAMWRVRHE